MVTFTQAWDSVITAAVEALVRREGGSLAAAPDAAAAFKWLHHPGNDPGTFLWACMVTGTRPKDVHELIGRLRHLARLKEARHEPGA